MHAVKYLYALTERIKSTTVIICQNLAYEQAINAYIRLKLNFHLQKYLCSQAIGEPKLCVL